MLDKELFISAYNGDFESIKTIGKLRYDMNEIGEYRDISHKVLFSEDIKEVAINISNISNCLSIVNNIKEAVRDGEIKSSKVQGKINLDSLKKYLNRLSMPSNLYVNLNHYGYLLVTWQNQFNPNAQVYDRIHIVGTAEEDIYKSIVERFISYCYELYLKNDSYNKLNKIAYDAYTEVNGVLKIYGLGMSSAHHGRLIVWDRDNNDSRYLTEEELNIVIDKSKKLLEAAKELETTLKY